ncbi:DUF6415 family natural product biosynthesis protein [Streptomyces sp. 4N124]|uniref:DUF6415 family natural product biosynthesis protein n=1 Tax=Streptomyces sp. 4N124 TaxID=3457420 RepID=UPI003FD4F442
MNSTHPHTDAPPLVTAALRAVAVEFLGESMLPRYEDLQRSARDFQRDLWQLISQIEQLTEGREDAPARVALAGIGEARRRLDLIERPGLHGEVERVKRLARSVIALCDHYDTLTGVVMCLACDQPIEKGRRRRRTTRSVPPAARRELAAAFTTAVSTPYAAAEQRPPHPRVEGGASTQPLEEISR